MEETCELNHLVHTTYGEGIISLLPWYILYLFDKYWLHFYIVLSTRILWWSIRDISTCLVKSILQDGSHILIKWPHKYTVTTLINIRKKKKCDAKWNIRVSPPSHTLRWNVMVWPVKVEGKGSKFAMTCRWSTAVKPQSMLWTLRGTKSKWQHHRELLSSWTRRYDTQSSEQISQKTGGHCVTMYQTATNSCLSVCLMCH